MVGQLVQTRWWYECGEAFDERKWAKEADRTRTIQRSQKQRSQASSTYRILATFQVPLSLIPAMNRSTPIRHRCLREQQNQTMQRTGLRPAADRHHR